MKRESVQNFRDVKTILKPDRLYRRSDFLKKVEHPDRAINSLLARGVLVKVLKGIYYKPAQKFFGNTVPKETQLVSKVLGRSKFLMISPHLYNSLNLGLTQLENVVYVYNQKRQVKLKLCNREFYFKRLFNGNFPEKITKEFLLVDLLNNMKKVGQPEDIILQRVELTLKDYDKEKLLQNARRYGKKKTLQYLHKRLGDI